MKTYELLFIFSATDTLPVESVNDVIKKHGGSIMAQDDWGVRQLNFRIKKKGEGHFVLFTAALPEDKISAVDASLKLVPSVLRHQIVHFRAVAKPTPVATPVESETRVEHVAPPKPTIMNEEELDKTIEKILDEKII